MIWLVATTKRNVVAMTNPRLWSAMVVVFGLSACGPSTPTPDTGATPESASSATPDAAGSSTASTDKPPAGSAQPASTGEAPQAGPKEATKEPNALVLEFSVEASKGALTQPEMDQLKVAMLERIAQSTKVGTPSSKGISAGRKVMARLIVDPPTEAKDGLSQKVTINGVTSDGKCPLFDLNAKTTLEGGKKDKADDLNQVRAAAIARVFDKLEAEATTMKPAASCSGEEKNKKK